VQAQLPSDRQDRGAGAVFSSAQDLERERIINRNDAFLESQLKELELFQRTAGRR